MSSRDSIATDMIERLTTNCTALRLPEGALVRPVTDRNVNFFAM